MDYEDLDLIGLKEKKAKKMANKAGYHLRVIERDGLPCIITRDYRTDRLNVVVANQEILEVINVG